MQDVLTLEEAASFLRCSPDTVRRRARAGELPAAKLGRAWRFRRAELDQWLADGGTRREALEDEGLLLARQEALTEGGCSIPLAEVKARLGL
jgi:excisionase family DNA binding protein